MNPFEGVKILGYEIINPRLVVAGISLIEYPSLMNPAILDAGVKHSLETYPGLERVQASIDGNTLILFLHGNVSDVTFVSQEKE